MGSKISSGGYSSSVGYRVKKNGLNCFVSAGHGIKSIGQEVLYNSTVCGKSLGTHIGENLDAAYCSLSSGFEVGNKTAHSLVTLNPSVQVLAVGGLAHMDGMETGHRQGSVTEVGKTVTFDNGKYVLRGLIEVALTGAQPGDSGGVVYTAGNNVAGIVQSQDLAKTHMYYVPANAINSYFGLTMY